MGMTKGNTRLLDLGTVPKRVDLRHAGLKAAVDDDPAPDPKLGGRGQRGARPEPHGGQDAIGREACAVGERDPHGAVLVVQRLDHPPERPAHAEVRERPF